MLLAFSSVLTAQKFDIAKIDLNLFKLLCKNYNPPGPAALTLSGESQDYYALFPGTVQQDYRGTGFLRIRGSRHDEIALTAWKA